MIHLEKLTYENFDDVFELKVKKVQYPFVASNCYSVAEAYVTMMNGGHVFPSPSTTTNGLSASSR